jgi:hypothetical protein
LYIYSYSASSVRSITSIFGTTRGLKDEGVSSRVGTIEDGLDPRIMTQTVARMFENIFCVKIFLVFFLSYETKVSKRKSRNLELKLRHIEPDIK